MGKIRDDAPELREIIGSAVNGVGPIEELAALGAATLALPIDRVADSFSAPAKWNADRRLAGALWRVKYGDDRRSAGLEASLLFAALLRKHPTFKNFSAVPNSPTMKNFAGRVIAEWAKERCEDCGGTGLKNPDPTNPSEIAARNASRTKRCETCQQHPGLAKIDEAARALAIDLPAHVYRKFWAKRFPIAHELLRRIEPSIERPLHSQRRKRTITRNRPGAHAAG